jgi:hypothetical protein
VIFMREYIALIIDSLSRTLGFKYDPIEVDFSYFDFDNSTIEPGGNMGVEYDNDEDYEGDEDWFDEDSEHHIPPADEQRDHISHHEGS